MLISRSTWSELPWLLQWRAVYPLRCRPWTAGVLLLVLGVGAAAADDFERGSGEAVGMGWPVDVAFEADREPTIVWRQDWAGTVDATVAAWRDALAGESDRDERLDLRWAYLAHRLSDRFPDQRNRAIDTWLDVAERLDERRDGSNQAQWWRQRALALMDAGDAADAVRMAGVYEAMLRRSEWGQWRWQSWVRVASQGLAALHAQQPEAVPDDLRAMSLRRLIAVRQSESDETGARLLARELGLLEGDAFAVEGYVARRLAALDQPVLAERAYARWLARLPADHSQRALVIEARDEMPEHDVDRVGGLSTNGLSVEAWATVRASDAVDMAKDVQWLLEVVGREGSLVSAEEKRVVSLWPRLSAWMRSQPASVQAELRATQEAEARQWLAEHEAEAADLAGVMTLFRRAPLAETTHRRMLIVAESAARRGQTGLAGRLLAEVAAHTADTALRDRLQAVQAERPAAGADVLAEARTSAPRWLRRPTTPLWPGSFLRGLPAELVAMMADMPSRLAVSPDGGRVVLAGPEAVLCYDAEGGLRWARRPAWTSAHDREPNFQQVELMPAGPFQPWVSDDLVYTRWGVDEHRRHATHLIALSLDDGAVRWSTVDDVVWQQRMPLSPPVVEDGRLYVLASEYGIPEFVRDVELLCLDAASGRLIWQQSLVSDDPALVGLSGVANVPHLRVNPSIYGHRVLVQDGAVYCQTNIGLLARVDARDGRIEWASRYDRLVVGTWRDVVGRLGASPVGMGGQVLFAPRDAPGVIAVDHETGEPAWDAPLLTPTQMAPLSGGRVLLADGRHLAAVDPATGELAWHRTLDHAIRGTVRVAGDRIRGATAEALVAVDAGSGEVVERREASLGEAFDVAWSAAGRPLAFGGGPASFNDTPTHEQTSGWKTGSEASLSPRWVMSRAMPRVWSSPAEARMDDAVLVASDHLLERVDVTDAGPRVPWTRHLPHGLRGHVWGEGVVALIYPHRAEGIDLATGERQWTFESQELEEIDSWQRFGDYLVLQSPSSSDERSGMGVIDLAQGRVLWARQLHSLFAGNAPSVTFDGEDFHFVTSAEWDGGRGRWHMKFDPRHGVMRSIREAERGNTPGLIQHEGIGDRLYGVGINPPRLVAWTPSGDDPLVEFAEPGETNMRNAPPEIQADGPWVRLRDQQPSHIYTWIFDERDSENVWFFEGEGQFIDGCFYALDDGAVLAHRLIDDGEPVRYEMMPPTGPDRTADPISVSPRERELWVVSVIRTERGQPERLRLDRFDARTAQHLGHETLHGAMYWRRPHVEPADAQWVGDTLLFVMPEGLYAFAPTAPGDTVESAGSSANATMTLDRESDQFVLHIRQPLTRADAMRGHEQFITGTWLELAFVSRWGDEARAAVGVNEQGHLEWQRFDDHREVVEPRQTHWRYDPQAGELVVQMRWSVDQQAHGDERFGEHMRFAVRLWHESDARLQPVSDVQLGGGVGGWSAQREAMGLYIVPDESETSNDAEGADSP
ncbi:MAG: PQQ-binding-like beta-propeller repeat protein [Phycisphaeraceae bacterium]